MTYLCSPPLFYGYILFMSAFSWLGLFMTLGLFAVHLALYLSSFLSIYFQYHRPF